MNRIIIFVGLILTATAALPAQIAQNGNYVLERSLVSAGGGTSGQTIAGRTLSLTGAGGEPAAGTTSSGAAYTVKGGFLTADALAPTAATVSISGKVLAPDGGGLLKARVTLTDPLGNVRTAISGSFGYYRFAEVEVGQIYVLTVESKRFQYAPLVLVVTEDLGELNFVAQP
jgi:hypothetical protein